MLLVSACNYVTESTLALAWWIINYLQWKEKVKQKGSVWHSFIIQHHTFSTFSSKLAKRLRANFWCVCLRNKIHWDHWAAFKFSFFFVCLLSSCLPLSSVSTCLRSRKKTLRLAFARHKHIFLSLRWSYVHLDFWQTDGQSAHKRENAQNVQCLFVACCRRAYLAHQPGVCTLYTYTVCVWGQIPGSTFCFKCVSTETLNNWTNWQQFL